MLKTFINICIRAFFLVKNLVYKTTNQLHCELLRAFSYQSIDRFVFIKGFLETKNRHLTYPRMFVVVVQLSPPLCSSFTYHLLLKIAYNFDYKLESSCACCMSQVLQKIPRNPATWIAAIDGQLKLGYLREQ